MMLPGVGMTNDLNWTLPGAGAPVARMVTVCPWDRKISVNRRVETTAPLLASSQASMTIAMRSGFTAPQSTPGPVSVPENYGPARSEGLPEFPRHSDRASKPMLYRLYSLAVRHFLSLTTRVGTGSLLAPLNEGSTDVR